MFTEEEIKEIAAAHKAIYDALAEQLQAIGPDDFRGKACDAASLIVAAKVRQ